MAETSTRGGVGGGSRGSNPSQGHKGTSAGLRPASQSKDGGGALMGNQTVPQGGPNRDDGTGAADGEGGGQHAYGGDQAEMGHGAGFGGQKPQKGDTRENADNPHGKKH